MKQTRQTFLTASIVVVPSFLFAKGSAGSAGGLRFAFISDMHYAHAGELADGGTSWGLTEAGLVELVDYLQSQRLDFIVLGGDFCNIDAWFTDVDMMADAHHSFERVAAEFGKLKIPIHYLRGNHESFRALIDGKPDRDHEFYGDKLYRYHCGHGTEKATYYEFSSKGWKFIAMDSGGMIASIEPQQVDWIKRVLEQTDADTPIALFIHGPLYPFFGDSPESTKLVTNYQEVIDLFRDHSLKMVYQGHLHKTTIVKVPQTNSAGHTHQIPFMLTGATFRAVNSPGDAGAGFHIIELEGKDFMVSEVKAIDRPPVRIWPVKQPH